MTLHDLDTQFSYPYKQIRCVNRELVKTANGHINEEIKPRKGDENVLDMAASMSHLPSRLVNPPSSLSV